MATIFGMPLGTFITRLLGAIVSGAVSIFLFFYLPNFASQHLPNGVLGVGESEIVVYGVLIAVLSGVQIVFSDRWLGDAATVGNGIIQIYYLYIITNGGVMSFAMSGMTISVNFTTFLYFLMLPSALAVASGTFRAITRSSLQKFHDAEEIILK